MKHNKPELKPKEFGAVILFFLLVFFIALLTFKKSNGQCYEPQQTTTNGVFTYASANSTNGFFAGEWITGYRIKKVSLGIGFHAIPNNTQPVLFQLRAGYNVTERLHVFVAGTRVTHNLDDKSRNKSTYSIGAQYHTLHFDRGSVFITAQYTPGYIGAGVGMSYNLVKED
ncbi:MAG TPA: hypothetical protein VK173_11415 [Lacibacter sp.]|nr:hypothetical protein [Lacibacter sp.]